MPPMLYHQTARSLMKAAPPFTQEVSPLIRSGIDFHALSLPQSILEWLSLDPDAQLFQRMTQMPHYFVSIPELRNHIKRHRLGKRDQLAIELIFENQGCFVMAASLENGDDPPVWISEDFHFCEGGQPTWLLHSHSFTECMLAFAWDFYCVDRIDWNNHFREVASADQLPEASRLGPTTYHRSAWFISREFRRVEIDGDRYTYLVEP